LWLNGIVGSETKGGNDHYSSRYINGTGGLGKLVQIIANAVIQVRAASGDKNKGR